MQIQPLTVDKWINNDAVKQTDGVTVTYSGGTPYGSGAARKTDIHVRCDTSAKTPTIVNNNVVETSGVGYTIYMTSAAACPKSGSSKKGWETIWFDGGSIIIIIAIVLIVIYLLAGGFYQYKFKGARTPKELILFGEYIFMVPLLVKDGVLFILHGFKKGDYVSV
jgi:hypothetical protein